MPSCGDGFKQKRKNKRRPSIHAIRRECLEVHLELPQQLVQVALQPQLSGRSHRESACSQASRARMRKKRSASASLSSNQLKVKQLQRGLLALLRAGSRNSTRRLPWLP
eukprot:m.127883 g.127883  ORF g.127883 m.127883 type:complete len:109 (+) comp15809_c0_seq5:570-896(+)